MPEQLTDDDRVYDRRWWTLGVLCLSLIMVIVGNTVLNVALPTLVRELDATSTQLQWIVDVYGLVFAGLLLTGGALGDRFGRKGALTIGLVIFAGGSAMAAMADSAGQLIVTRGIMGVGAALVMPATLSILTTVFPPQERARAIAVWAGLAGAGAAIGPVAGGWLLEHFWWGSVFLVNLPLIAVALVGGRLLVPTSRDPRQPPLDVVGAGLSIVALASCLYAIIEAPNHGWTSIPTLEAAGVGLAFGVAFAAWELRARHPMLDLRFFRNRRFSAGSAAITLVFFAMFGTFFLLTQYLQLVLGYSALEAGLRTLPAPLMIMVTAPMSARFVERFGTRAVVATGLATVAAGLGMASTLGHPQPVLAAGPGARGAGHRDGPDHAPVDDGHHVVAPDGEGGRRLGGQRHHPRAGWGAGSRRPRQPGRVPLRGGGRSDRRPHRCVGSGGATIARRRPPGRRHARRRAGHRRRRRRQDRLRRRHGRRPHRRRPRRPHRRSADRPVHAGPVRCRSRPAGRRRRAGRALGFPHALAAASPARAGENPCDDRVNCGSHHGATRGAQTVTSR